MFTFKMSKQVADVLAKSDKDLYKVNACINALQAMQSEYNIEECSVMTDAAIALFKAIFSILDKNAILYRDDLYTNECIFFEDIVDDYVYLTYQSNEHDTEIVF